MPVASLQPPSPRRCDNERQRDSWKHGSCRLQHQRTSSSIQDSHHHCCARPPPPPYDAAYLYQPAGREQSKLQPLCVAVCLSMVCRPYFEQHHAGCLASLHRGTAMHPARTAGHVQQVTRSCTPRGKHCLPPLYVPRHLPSLCRCSVLLFGRTFALSSSCVPAALNRCSPMHAQQRPPACSGQSEFAVTHWPQMLTCYMHTL